MITEQFIIHTRKDFPWDMCVETILNSAASYEH